MKNKAKITILILPFLVLSFMALLLLAERIGLQYDKNDDNAVYLPDNIKNEIKQDQQAESLMLVDTSADAILVYKEHMEDVFEQMRIGYDTADISKQSLPNLDKYRTVVVTFYNLDILSEDIFTLFEWVNDGGKLMFSCAPEPSTVFQVIKQKLGILESGYNYIIVDGVKIVSDFMVGAKGNTYMWDDPWDASLAVVLKDSCRVHMVSVGDNSTPMIWEYDYGKGRVVVNNHYIADKASRGLAAASYSLLEDILAYPVINASTFFIDDFPAPVPQGGSKYIASYGRTVESFYSSVWWPDLLALSKKYGFTYTGVIIEDYTDSTEAPFKRNNSTRRFSDFGGMLLKNGGEIGIHGYNHQPLVPLSFDYKDKYEYNKWRNMDEMTLACNELVDFIKTLFPDINISVYVPPSNILSAEGREVITTRIPGIRCIASSYLLEDIQFEQEFDVSEDGIINLPRIISGTVIDNYMEWAAMNELNFHYVNTHFMHPDDVLDPDRGAELGWNAMRNDFESYLTWLYESVPNIRNMNASEAAAAVERYDYMTVKRELSDNEYNLSLGRFYDEAFFMLRINDGMPGEVTGGIIEKLDGNLYLLYANQPEISIEINK